jgi:hypothetical protein
MFETNGLVNHVLIGAGVVATTPAWFSDPVVAWVPIVLADVWKSTPFMALLLLAGLQAIDPTLYEAAALDGAGAGRQTLGITLPLLMPTILAAVVFRSLDAFRVFDLIYVMTRGGPMPQPRRLVVRISMCFAPCASDTNRGVLVVFSLALAARGCGSPARLERDDSLASLLWVARRRCAAAAVCRWARRYNVTQSRSARLDVRALTLIHYRALFETRDFWRPPPSLVVAGDHDIGRHCRWIMCVLHRAVDVPRQGRGSGRSARGLGVSADLHRLAAVSGLT